MSLSKELQSQFSAVQVAGLLGSIATAVSAAGGTQATATTLASQYNRVTTATLLQGVILPTTSNVGDELEVVNATSVNICVYPPTGGKLNGQAANMPLVMAANRCHTFFSVDGTSWDVDSI